MHHRIIAKDRGESVICDRSKVVSAVRKEHSVPEPSQTCPAIFYVLLVNIHQSKLARTPGDDLGMAAMTASQFQDNSQIKALELWVERMVFTPKDKGPCLGIFVVNALPPRSRNDFDRLCDLVHNEWRLSLRRRNGNHNGLNLQRSISLGRQMRFYSCCSHLTRPCSCSMRSAWTRYLLPSREV